MTISELIEGLNILAKYTENGLDQGCFTAAEHDIVYFYLTDEQLPEDSDDGKRLDELGFHIDSDTNSWAFFT